MSRAAERFEFFHAHDSGDIQDEHHFRVNPARWAIRTQRACLPSFMWSLHCGLGAWVPAAELDRLCDQTRPDVLLTVAEGQLVGPVRRLTERHRLPLVTIHHDWSSIWLPAPSWVKWLVDRQLRQLYAVSRVNLCVSGALRDEFGQHPDAWILPPTPDDSLIQPKPTTAQFHITYAGVSTYLYRDEIEGLAAALLATGEQSVFRIYGPPPARGSLLDSDPDELRRLHRGLVTRGELAEALAIADALLVVSPFGRKWEKIAKFSFPSKIPEYCRFGKPLLVWGPPHSTAVDWANRSGAALVVVDPHPAAVVAAIRRLHNEPALRARLAAAATAAAKTDFNPERLQALFERSLLYALGRASRPPSSEIN